MSQLINTKVYRYIRNIGEVELVDEYGNYTGEIVDNYSEEREIRAVIKRNIGKYHSAQFGTLYAYKASLQHKGKPVLKSGDLVFIDSKSDLPDMIVKEIVPSINYTTYYLDHKVSSGNAVI